MNTKTISLIVLPLLLSACSISNINIGTINAEPNSTVYETAPSSPNPDSMSLRRQFENDIAEKLLTGIQALPNNTIPVRLDLIDQQSKLKSLVQKLSRLDKSLLKPELKHAIHEAQMFELSLSLEIKNWEHRNHLQDLPKLLPPQSYSQYSISDISKISQAILNSAQGLQTIQANMSLGSQFYYPKLLVSDSKNLCSKLSNPKNNPILDRYQHILLYSKMDTKMQKENYQELEKKFKSTVVPAYQAFCKFLGEFKTTPLSTIFEEDSELIDGSQLVKDSVLIKETKLNQLHHALDITQSSIDEILKSLPQSSLKEVYETHQEEFILKQQQALLDQLTQFVADLHYGLKRWFNDPIQREVLIAASDGIENKPFQYESNTAFFDLSLLAQLPSFELETLSYQFTLPGMHMLNYASSHINDALWQDFSAGWSLYILKLPEPPVYYSHPLSRMAALSRKKLAIHAAISDINLQLGHWTPKDALGYLEDETPYPVELLRRQLINILGMPGHASNSWFISQKIEELWQLDHGLSIKEFHDRIFAVAPADLNFLTNQMPEILLRKH